MSHRGAGDEEVVMTQQIPARDHPVAVEPVLGTPTPQATRGKQRRRHMAPFWRHFLQMLAVMVAGAIGTGAVFLSVVGLKTWGEVTTAYPTQALLAMAGGMTAPMVAWMMYRGMGRRNSLEMAAAMVLPVIPFLGLVWLGVTRSAACSAYCAVMVVAMLALMLYRRAEYSKEM
jgi:hypothetical protein